MKILIACEFSCSASRRCNRTSRKEDGEMRGDGEIWNLTRVITGARWAPGK